MQGTWKFKGPSIPESDKTFIFKKDAIIILTIIILSKTIGGRHEFDRMLTVERAPTYFNLHKRLQTFENLTY